MKRFLLCLSWLLASCASHRSASSSFSSAPIAPGVSRPDHILFLTLNISRDSASAQSSIRILNTIRKEGVIKKDIEPGPHTGARLKCELMSGEQVTDSFFIEHPLYKDVEYVNDRNSFEKKQLQLRSQDFFIRFQQGQADQLRISELLPGTERQELLTIKLP